MSKDLDELTKLNKDYVDSVQNCDVKRFDEILAQDFYCTNPDKSFVDRAAFLKQTAIPVKIKNLKEQDVKIRIFGDFTVNLDGDDRATAAGHPGHGDQRYAYQIGAGVGQLKKKHDWQVNVFWQRQDQYALDPNLVDTEFWDSKVNLQGIGVTAGYMLSDAVWLNFTYGYAWRADDGLGTGGLGDIAINPVSNFQLFQADLNLKF